MGKCRNFMDSHNWGEVCCFFSSDFDSSRKRHKKRRRKCSPEFGPGPVIPDGSFFFRNTSGVISLLSRLTPGTPLDSVIIDGTEVPLTSFVSFNRQTNIATFEGADGSLIFANARQISAIAFPPVATPTFL